MEPFITPSYYQKYTTAIDEWTLSVAMAADTASGGLNQLEDHYKTFIVRPDLQRVRMNVSPLHLRPRKTLLK
jgi:glucan 1,3-beta-glucosidase